MSIHNIVIVVKPNDDQWQAVVNIKRVAELKIVPNRLSVTRWHF